MKNNELPSLTPQNRYDIFNLLERAQAQINTLSKMPIV